MRNLTFDLKALSYTGPGVFNDFIEGFTFEFGDDEIDLGSADGNNIIYGDLQDFTLSISGGQAKDGAVVNAYITSNTFLMGDDTISSGDGDNIIYGDLRDWTLTITGGLATDGGILNQRISPLQGPGGVFLTPPNSYVMGDDDIVAGNGNNVVFGDFRDLIAEDSGGVSIDGEQLQNRNINNEYFMGNDDIILGDGNNEVYGDFRDWINIATGGQALQGSAVFL